MEQGIKNRILSTMADVFELKLEDINENSTSDNTENWDSLRHMNLILSLEEEFSIRFQFDEISEISDFNSIYKLISGKLIH
jgi:acyl carrier protein